MSLYMLMDLCPIGPRKSLNYLEVHVQVCYSVRWRGLDRAGHPD
jgi:hypothetical protein